MARPEVRTRLEREYYAALKDMAEEADMKPNELVGSLIRAVLDDDAKAHGRSLDQHNQ